MMSLISLMFVLDTLLWATHVKRDIHLMVDLLYDHEEKLRNIDNQHDSFRLVANSLVLINVSSIVVSSDFGSRHNPVCDFRQRGGMESLGTRERKQAGTARMHCVPRWNVA